MEEYYQERCVPYGLPYDKACWTTYVKKKMKEAIYGALAGEPHDISLLNFLWSLKTGSHVLQIPALNEEMKFIGGAQQISNGIKDKLGDKVKSSTYSSVQFYMATLN